MTFLIPTDVLYPVPDDEAIADLDWVTGMLRFFVSYEELQRIFALEPELLDPDSRAVLEAVTHEHAHVLQLALTGFGYDFSLRLLEVVTAATQAHRTLDDINAHRSEYAAALEPLFASLDRPGPTGVSPRAIMESSAHVVQKTTHYPDVGAIGYARMLDDEIEDPNYRLAYDVAAEYLGADALYHLPNVANLSLLTREPETVFTPLLAEFRARASRLDHDHNHELGIELLRSDRYAALLLGTSADLAEAGRGRHPILDRILDRLVGAVDDGLLGVSELFASGRVSGDEATRLLIMPASFPPIASAPRGTAMVWVAGTWSAADRDVVNAMRYAFSVSQLVQQDLPDVEPAPLRPSGRGVAPDETDQPVAVRNFEFDQVGREGGGVDYFLEVLARVEQNPQLVRSLRGTAVVTVPDDEFPDTAPLLDAGVQDFLQRLFDAVPHLMYYLSDVPQHGALLELMAARAPEHLADVPGRGLALTMSTGVLLAIVAVMTEAAAFAVRQDQLPSVVFRHLKRLPEDIRDALERAVTEQLGDPG